MSYTPPKGWREVPLPEALFFQEGPGLRKHQFRESGIPFLNIRTFKQGRVDRSLCQFLGPEEVDVKYQHFLLLLDLLFLLYINYLCHKLDSLCRQ